MNILDIIDEFNGEFKKAVNNLPCVRADEIGLDRRAGYAYVDSDNELIIVPTEYIRSFNYYGGFEYVDDGTTITAGDYKIYGTGGNSNHNRIESAIEHYRMLVDKSDEEE